MNVGDLRSCSIVSLARCVNSPPKNFGLLLSDAYKTSDYCKRCDGAAFIVFGVSVDPLAWQMVSISISDSVSTSSPSFFLLQRFSYCPLLVVLYLIHRLLESGTRPHRVLYPSSLLCPLQDPIIEMVNTRANTRGVIEYEGLTTNSLG